MAIAYAYNEYIPYAPEIPFQALDPINAYQPSNVGQKQPYLAGRKNIKTYTIGVGSYGTAPYPGKDVFGRKTSVNRTSYFIW